MSRLRDVAAPRQSIVSADFVRATLAVWERLSATRDLQNFLAGVADELTTGVDLQGIGAVAFAPATGFRLLAGWNAAVQPQPDETAEELHRRTLIAVAAPISARPRVAYEDNMFRRVHDGNCLSCADLLAKDAWYEYEFSLAASGMRAYASVPLFDEDQLMGLAMFARRAPRAFSDADVAILTGVSRAIGVAIGRTLASEEIARRRDGSVSRSPRWSREFSVTVSTNTSFARHETPRRVASVTGELATFRAFVTIGCASCR